MSAQAVVLVAAAGIAFAVPLPAQFFSTDTEQTIFRVLIVAAAALVVWRDDFGLFKQTPSSSSSSSSSSGVEKNRSEGGATTSATSTSGDAADADDSSPSSPSSSSSAALSKIKILYASTTGNAKSLAMALRKAVNTHTRKATATVGNLKDYEPEDLVNEKCVAVVVSTWTGGEPPRDAVFFDKFLTDAVLDFRRSKTMLEDLSFCVFGLGSSAYSKDVFCTAAKRIHRSLRRLGATPFAEIAFGDDAQGDMDAEFAEWVRSEVLPNFAKAQAKVSRAGGQNDSAADGPGAAPEGSAAKKPLSKRQARLLRQKQNEARYGPSRAKVARTAKKRQKMKPADLEEEDIINDTFLSLPERQEQEEAAAAAKEKARQEAAANLAAAAGFDPRYLPEEEEEELAAGAGATGDDQDSGMLDIEAIGGALHAQKMDADAQKNKPLREMVTGRQRQALTKEGYKIIGTHSAVKLCRWTKHQLRGRGGCYKHTCYGITSYQCMEATPSLACANKCTFCWRHHKNPVGTEWRWKMDPPREIVKEAIRLHQGMINEYAGAPGVKKERLKEAFTVRHCALSLVGEPIMYPRINELVGELHKRHISTFLVTNAQFPECISTLAPVTQLYVSIDAATKESLKAVDRPLFSDFWERFIASLKALRDKRQRTVYRLTLLKGENMDGLEQYARLIAMGQPDFIEIKAVTFCGSSAATDLSHSNVPFHSEVLEFSTKLMNLVNKLHASTSSSHSSAGEGDEKVPDADVEEPLSYGIACEHHHSNLVLVAKTSFQDKETGAWNTWIDYEKFHKMVDAGESFTAMDYTAPTPYWAVYGAAERGMDPEENRWYHNRTVRRAKAGELSEEILAEYMDNPADQKHKMGSGQSDPFAEEKTSTETAKKDATGGGATENE